jgi:aminocarboxymuconate-semialdehyde decarboxylase
MTINRRTFLRTASVSGGFAFCRCHLAGLGATSASVRSSQSDSARRRVVIGGRAVRTIDMHSHGYVHDVWPLINTRKEAAQGLAMDKDGVPVLAAGPMALDGKTLDNRLREMDRQGIDVHVISVHPGQYHYWAEPELSAEIVKIQNETIAKVRDDHPDRFVAFGNVSIQHPDLAVEQLDYGAKKLDLRGFIIGGSVNASEISNAKFDPFWTKAQELGVVIFVHPAGFLQAGERFSGSGYLGNTVGNPLETAVALSHMIFEGFLDRYPNLKVLAAHGGGFLPSYIGRSDNCHAIRPDCQKMKRKPSDYLRGGQLYFDALVYDPEGLRHLIAATGASQIVLGTDFAFDIATKTPVDSILQTPGLGPEEQVAILGGNAARLLKVTG